jgi:kinesin family protein 11
MITNAIKKQHEIKETNIQVVVRCRPLNETERKEGLCNVIECTSRDITVNVSTQTFLNPLSSNNQGHKVYSFDRVFGEQSVQKEIYSEVVSPLIAEVLSGYNCTIFAYGQTGTGKTYTMEGSPDERYQEFEEDQPINATLYLSGNSGMIPRALCELFEILERQETDYSVKVSFIELYNEELRDLLIEDEIIQSTSSATSFSGNNSKLKLFESPQGGGVIIQNLIELVVHNIDDIMKILKKGSMKRQSAITFLNQYSSRSHSIFSITVTIREISGEGEEVLKMGKLNLVDLAGSENICKSGAENRRAREAGMINQSLLTLGRVINALVEHSQHIPYRESKLTRLLQDSLGGRTKTCIIATISPLRIHLEETLNTLDYAYRAKNIRNRPEINQKLAKKTLIREYVLEIEKLRHLLQLTRNKEGVYMDIKDYNEMNEQLTYYKTHLIHLEDCLKLKEKHIMEFESELRQSSLKCIEFQTQYIDIQVRKDIS